LQSLAFTFIDAVTVCGALNVAVIPASTTMTIRIVITLVAFILSVQTVKWLLGFLQVWTTARAFLWLNPEARNWDAARIAEQLPLPEFLGKGTRRVMLRLLLRDVLTQVHNLEIRERVNR